MLEKIGLPAKPSMRGTTWVVDASHCQGCQSRFTFFNRKHHCRRCGGLLCNNCTLQRMYLRGQGDQPVRICNPCKDHEEAARFTARQSRRNQAAKGTSRMPANSENEIVQQILGSDVRLQSSTGNDSIDDLSSIAAVDDSSVVADSSSSILQEDEGTRHNRKRELSESSSLNGSIHSGIEKDLYTPDELRQQAQEEKKKYHILKKEGKAEEALQAFKRGKELERRAEALELSLRKSRRRAASAGFDSMEKKQEDPGDLERKIPDTFNDGQKLELRVEAKKKISSGQGKDEKDDISSALKELGWTEDDLQDGDRKTSKVSLEGELSSLLGISHNSKVRSPGNESSSGIDRSQVLAHKRKALALKREGKLTEAKEELKKAKLLEKQLEEQEMFGQEVESDDELASLIRSLDSESKDAKPLGGLGLKLGEDPVFELSQFAVMGDEFDENTGIDVTDDDIHDPEIALALRSMGWEEEDSEELLNMPGDNPYFEDGPRSSTQDPVAATFLQQRDRAALQQEVLSLKREALALKRAGNVAEAKEKLRQSKVLEKELEDLQLEQSVHDANSKFETYNPLDIKRPGSGNTGKIRNLAGKTSFSSLQDEDNETIEITDEDMVDPELAKVLKDMGWQEADQESVSRNNSEGRNNFRPQSANISSVASPFKMSKTKTELQKELLGLKRKALALRRQGRIEEADAELNKGQLLEKQLEEIENSLNTQNIKAGAFQGKSKPRQKVKETDLGVLSLKVEDDKIEVTDEDMGDPELSKELSGLGWQEADQERVSIINVESHDVSQAQSSYRSSMASPFHKPKTKGELQKELLGLKRKALALRREGRLEEADAELSKGKILEKRLEEMETSQKTQNTQGGILQDSSTPGPKGRVLDPTVLSFNVDKDAERPSEQNMLDPPMLIAARSLGSSDDNDETKRNVSSTSLQLSNTGPSSSQTLLEDFSLIHGVSKASTDPSNGKGQILMKSERTGSGGLYDKKDTWLPINAKGEESTNIVSENQSLNVMDLLTGDTWKPSSLEQVEDFGKRRDSKQGNNVVATTSGISIGKNITEVHAIANSEKCVQHDSITQEARTVVLNAADVSNKTNTTKSGSETTKLSLSPSAVSESPVQHDTITHRETNLVLNAADIPNEINTTKSDAKTTKVHVSPSAPRFQNLKEEILSHKRKALQLKREGKLQEAKEELRLAKLLEREGEVEYSSGKQELSSSHAPAKVNVSEQLIKPQVRNDEVQDKVAPIVQSIGIEANVSNRKQQIHKQGPSKDRFKLQQESLAHKRRARVLRREGRVDEAEAEIELAKSLDSQMDELSGSNSQVHSSNAGIGSDDGDLLDDFLDPQLLSALKGIGWNESDLFTQMPTKGLHPKNKEISVSNPVRSNLGNETLQPSADKTKGLKEERSHLEEKIKSEKLRALNLKRAGKQAEALDALRGAKQLEKKLQSLAA